VAEALQASCGIRLHTSFDPTSVLMQRIAAGERADLIVAIDGDIDRLIAAGIVSPIGRTPLVGTEVAVAVKAGEPAPDISTAAAFVDAVLKARSVAYSKTGASGIYFARLIAQLGIVDAVNAKATVITSGLVAETLVDGRADLAIQQLSELLTVDGITLVGGLPADIAHRTDFSAAVFVASVDQQVVQDALAFLASNIARDAYRAYGLSLPAASTQP
jgi:molybdate transport system substrate-binding protein